MEFESDAATVGGWVTEQYGSLPEKDATLEYENLSIVVSDADDKRVHEVIVTINPKESEEDEE